MASLMLSDVSDFLKMSGEVADTPRQAISTENKRITDVLTGKEKLFATEFFIFGIRVTFED